MFTENYPSKELLEEREEGGYPAEYLLSRIRGKRVSLITDWEPLICDKAALVSLFPSLSDGFASGASSVSIWKDLLAEYRWVYLQMEKSLRDIFRHFFFYSELRTLFFCLRLRAVGEGVKMEQILAGSLFSKKLRKALVDSEDGQDMLEEVEEFFMSLSSGFRGLNDIYAKDGFRGVEQHLTNHYLEYVMDSDLHPVMREFFVRLVDARNVIALYKHLRWELKDVPYFIKGGSIKASRLRSILAREDIFEVMSIIRSLTGIIVKNPDPTGVENTLYRGMTRFLRKKGREISGIGFILDYLWRCSLEAMNLGILFHGKDMERDALRAELLL